MKAKHNWRTWAVPVIAVLFGLVGGAILIALTGKNPFEAYGWLLGGWLRDIRRFSDTFAIATQLILTGLSVTFAFRTGLFNIGAAGQMLMGGLAATAIGLLVPLPSYLLVPLVVLGATLAGALWGTLPGFLKAQFNVHEVVSTIMLNWIAVWLVAWIVPTWLKSNQETQSARLPLAASLKMDWLSELTNQSSLNLGLVLALVATVIIAIILKRTTLGFELKAVGFNRLAAEYAGMEDKRNIVVSMAIAGALAGLAGATQYAGYAVNLQIQVLPSQGFDGIAVALLGNLTPLGVVASSMFFGILYTSRGLMNAALKIPPEISDTIIAIIIYLSATSILIHRLLDKLTPRKEEPHD